MLGLSSGAGLTIEQIIAALDEAGKDPSGIEYALLAGIASGNLFVINFEVGEE